MARTIWPPQLTGGDLVLRNAALPVALVDGWGASPDGDGFARGDVAILDGRLQAFGGGVSSAPGAREVDLDGGLIMPLFVDMHTHLDKGHIWPRAKNPDGTHPAAARAVGIDRKSHWTVDDITRRFTFGLQCAYAHGTAAVRTHLDSYDPDEAWRAWTVFKAMRRQWAGRIDLQAVCMARIDLYADPDAQPFLRMVAEEGSALGGILKTSAAPAQDDDERLRFHLGILFEQATSFGLDVDLHVDETGDPAARTLEVVAEVAMAKRFAGRVTCGHCCSLAVQSPDIAGQVIAKVRDAGIAIVCLPFANEYLQGRAAGCTPTWRGITRVHELAAAGVSVAVASDNCRDPFFAYGDHDLLEVYRAFVRLAHADDRPWYDAVTSIPARIMRRPGGGLLQVGAAADLVAFRARTLNELLSRPQSDRIVLRNGQAIDTTLPDYRDLD